MSQIGTVIRIENTPTNLYIVIQGIGKVEDGQKLYNGEDIWTIVKKRWTKGKETSFLLKSLVNKIPIIGQKLELAPDNNQFKIEDGHPFEVIDCFILHHKNEVINVVTVLGITKLEPNDILFSVNTGSSWKILGTSQTLDKSGLNHRSMVSIESNNEPPFLPLQGMKLIKTNPDPIPVKIPKTIKSSKKSTKKSE